MTRAAVLTALSATAALPTDTPLTYALRTAQALYPGLTAGSGEQLAEQLALRGWTTRTARAGSFWSDGCHECGWVEKPVFNYAPTVEFVAVTSSGGRQRRSTEGLAFFGLPG